jgi:hypothetical protein
MVLSRLPIAVAPADQETVASYLTRLANLHGLPLRELWNRSAFRAQVAGGATSSPTGWRP